MPDSPVGKGASGFGDLALGQNAEAPVPINRRLLLG